MARNSKLACYLSANTQGRNALEKHARRVRVYARKLFVTTLCFLYSAAVAAVGGDSIMRLSFLVPPRSQKFLCAPCLTTKNCH
eukprot:SAG11_NODE_497_length_8941_cov_5.441303_9_plen_83_part_00